MDNKRIDEILAEIKAMLDQWEQEARAIYFPDSKGRTSNEQETTD